MRRLAGILFLSLLVVSILTITACSRGTTTTSAPTSTVSKAPATSVAPATSTAPAATISAAPAPVAKGEPITLRAVTHLPRTNPNVHSLFRLAEEIQKQTNGQVVIKYIGGPEVIPDREQPKAIQTGVFDIGMCVYTHYESMGITAGMINCSRLTAEQEKPGTPFDNLVQAQHNKTGLFHLGRKTYAPDEWYRIWSKKQINSTKELAGLRIGGIGTQFVEASKVLGAVNIMISQPEIYTALERGMVDAVTLPPVGIFYDQSLYEVAKFAIEHTYFNCSSGYIVNMNSWSKIPKALQDIMIKAKWDTAVEHKAYLKDVEAKQRTDMIAKGLKFINFSPDDAKFYVDTIYNTEISYQLKNNPEATKYNEIFQQYLKK